MEPTMEVTKVEAQPPAPTQYDAWINIALEKDADLDKIERMLEMKREWEQGEAKKAYFAAMVEAQANMPVVLKDKDNKQTHSRYASYESIIRKIKPIYTEQGFSVMFYEGDATRDGEIRVCADIMHKQGHSEKRFVDVPMDDKGIKGRANKTQTHAKGSSISYGRSYLLRMIFNISTGDEDDGNAASPPPAITEAQLSRLGKIIEDKIDSGEFTAEAFSKRLEEKYNTTDTNGLTGAEAEELINLLRTKAAK